MAEIQSPLNVVRSLFENYRPEISFAEIHARVTDHFDRVFHSSTELRKIPSLNTTPAHRLPPKSLVRFRCMIQDQQDPEFYVAATETTNSQTGEKRWTCSMYTDEIPEEFNRATHIGDPSQRFSEKHLFHCVSVPGESPWVTKSFRDGLESTMDDVTELTSRIILGDRCPVVNSKYIASKYPFPEEHTAALVKMYKKDESLKVTEQVEFIGVLGAPVEANDGHDDDMMGDTSRMVPPDSLPCLHAITFRRIEPCNNNPHLLETCTDEAVTEIQQNIIRQSIRTTRNQLLVGIADVLGDDHLAAEFLLLQLFSRIHMRQSDTILGNLSLNFINAPAVPDHPKDSESSDSPTSLRLSGFAKDVFNMLQLLLPKAHSIPLSLDTLNQSSFYPKSNGDLLESGILQVAKGTWFAVDETVLEEGALDDQGVRNMQALKNVLTNQTLQYAFPFTTVEVKTDIGFLILSNKKSLLPVECVVPLSDYCSREAGRRCSNDRISRLASEDENTLDRYREYIGVFRQAECKFPERMASYIQNDFVEQRRNAFEKGTEPLTETDLAFLLTLARVVSLSFGSLEMTEETWSHARRLDEARKERLRNFGKTTSSTDDDRVAR